MPLSLAERITVGASGVFLKLKAGLASWLQAGRTKGTVVPALACSAWGPTAGLWGWLGLAVPRGRVGGKHAGGGDGGPRASGLAILRQLGRVGRRQPARVGRGFERLLRRG